MRPEDTEMVANICSFERMEAAINEFQPFKAPGPHSRDGADNKICIRMLRCVRKLCPHAAPHRIQTQLSSHCTAPHCKLNIF